MNTVVYADMLFLIDFSMDFLTFYIVSRILRQKAKLIRICSASAMGGIYSVVSLGFGEKGIFAFALDIFVCFVMCMTAFLEKSPKRFRRMPLYTVTFFVVSSMLGGAMTAIFSLFNRSVTDVEAGREDLSLWVFGLVALLSGIATMVGSDIIGKSGRARFGKLSIRLGNRKMTLEAMSDSGNMLKDPIGGKDVVIIDRKRGSRLVPSLASGDFSSLPQNVAKSLRLIPVRTATGEGILAAFCPDEVTLEFEGDTKQIDVLIALSKEDMKDGRIEAIVSADYFI